MEAQKIPRGFRGGRCNRLYVQQRMQGRCTAANHGAAQRGPAACTRSGGESLTFWPSGDTRWGITPPLPAGWLSVVSSSWSVLPTCPLAVRPSQLEVPSLAVAKHPPHHQPHLLTTTHPACSFASSPDPCELFLILLSSHRLCLVLLALTFNIFICLPRACRRSRSLSPLNHAPASTCTTRLPQLPVAAAFGYRKDHQTRRGSQTLTDLRNLTSPTLRARPATALRLDRNTSTYPIHATAIGHSSCRIHHCSPFDGAGHPDPAPNAPVKA